MKNIVTLLLILSVTLPAAAEVEVDWGAFIENEVRANLGFVDRYRQGSPWAGSSGINRNQTTFGLELRAGLVPEKLRFVGDAELVWTGFSDEAGFDGLSERAAVTPYYLESRAAYLEVVALLPDLDLRVGRQVVHWGAADMFNPTDNLNALDLEDPLRFGDASANQMVRLDYALFDAALILTAVWVPVFQPAMLPRSARYEAADPSSEFPFVDPRVRFEAEKIRNLWLRNPDYYRIDQPAVEARLPETSLENSQVALRAQLTMGLFDGSLSYYRGFDDIPHPVESVSHLGDTDEAAADGTPVKRVMTSVAVTYVRQQVLGFDLGGQLPFLDDAGFWFEGAFVFPEALSMSFDVTEVAPGARVIHGATVTNTPFFKYTTGFDYTFTENVFLNCQFVHGFPDEFGAENLNDYVVAGFDFKFLREKLLFRLFGLAELPHDDTDLDLDEDADGLMDSTARGASNDGRITSYVAFPSVTVRPVDGLELALGAYLSFGHEESKLAQTASGPSLAFFRARAAF